jgi:hypothetical protein
MDRGDWCLLFLVCWFIPLCGGGVVECERVVFVLVLLLLIVEKVLALPTGTTKDE